MGSGSWDDNSWRSYSSANLYDTSGRKKKKEEIFHRETVNEDLVPLKFKNGMREALDSADHPESLPVIIAQDVTGSMGSVVDACLEQLGDFVKLAYDKNVIKDMQLAFMGIGDVIYDHSPIQFTQFESDIRIAKALQDLYLEGGGGGNDFESYIAAWYMAEKMVKSDAWDKRKKKGYLFTIGDEEVTPELTVDQIRKFINGEESNGYTAEELYAMASKQWNIYHIVVEQGSHCRYGDHADEVVKSFNKVIGQNVIRLKEVKDLSNVIISTLQLANGMTKEEVLKDWDGTTAIASISHAIKDLEGTNGESTDEGAEGFVTI